MAERARGRIPTWPFLACGGLALLSGLWAGLLRLGWWNVAQPHRAPPAWAHGPLLLGGFLGLAVGLERSVALSALAPRGRPRRWPYLGPAACALGTVALLAGAPPALGAALLAAGSAGLVAVFVLILRLRTDAAHLTMALGAGAWLGGNLVWISGAAIAAAVPWWVGFLVLTVAGERLELARLSQVGSRHTWVFAAAMAAVLAGLALSLFRPAAGLRTVGAGLVVLGTWLSRYDLARRNLRSPGLPRYMAAALLAGYAWLGLGGLLWMIFARAFGGGLLYDAMVHAILLGFGFSMIFAHAPIIAPALTGASVRFHPRFYAHVFLLHASLLSRVAADLADSAALRRWSSMGNVAAVLLFVASTALASTRTKAPVAAR